MPIIIGAVAGLGFLGYCLFGKHHAATAKKPAGAAKPAAHKINLKGAVAVLKAKAGK